MQRRNRKFDFIFGDLTDTPVEANAATDDDDDTGDNLLLHRRMLSESLPLLNTPGGRFVTHCNGKSAAEALANFEDLVRQIFGCTKAFDVKKREAFVPSFMEVWIFYEIVLKM